MVTLTETAAAQMAQMGWNIVPTGGIMEDTPGLEMKYNELKLAGRPNKRRFLQPAFKHEYMSLRDIQMRLRGCVFLIENEPYYVAHIGHLTPKDKEYNLFLHDHKKEMWYVPYSCPELDLRNPEPKYIQIPGSAGFMVRFPRRQQQQGLSSSNTYLKLMGAEAMGRDGRFDQISWERNLEALRPKDAIQWNSNLQNLMREGFFHSCRLSDNVGVFYNKGEFCVEYKGRVLGPLTDDVIFGDALDCGMPWIRRDVNTVGLSLREK